MYKFVNLLVLLALAAFVVAEEEKQDQENAELFFATHGYYPTWYSGFRTLAYLIDAPAYSRSADNYLRYDNSNSRSADNYWRSTDYDSRSSGNYWRSTDSYSRPAVTYRFPSDTYSGSADSYPYGHAVRSFQPTTYTYATNKQYGYTYY